MTLVSPPAALGGEAHHPGTLHFTVGETRLGRTDAPAAIQLAANETSFELGHPVLFPTPETVDRG